MKRSFKRKLHYGMLSQVAFLACTLSSNISPAAVKEFCSVGLMDLRGKKIEVAGKINQVPWETGKFKHGRFGMRANVEIGASNPCTLTIYTNQNPEACRLGATVKAEGTADVIVMFFPPVPDSIISRAKIKCTK